MKIITYIPEQEQEGQKENEEAARKKNLCDLYSSNVLRLRAIAINVHW